MGLEKVGEEGDFVRLRSTADIGNIIDVKLTPIGRGQMGVGTVHHIAWRAVDDFDQLDWKQHVVANGYGVTPVQDRNYLTRFTLESTVKSCLKSQPILRGLLMMNL
jgi:glyoxalase family protein